MDKLDVSTMARVLRCIYIGDHGDVRALSRANVMRVCQLSVSNSRSSTAGSSKLCAVATRTSTFASA